MRMRAGRFLVLLASLALPGIAAAACLLTDYSVRAEYDRSLMVLTGRVIAERAVAASGEHYDGAVYSVQVDEVYRGHPGRSFEVFSENSSGRFPMQRSERYLLFISQDVDQLVVDNCGNSGPVSDKTEVLRAVRAFASPKRGGQKPNKPLERSGISSSWPKEPASTGRSALSR